MIRIQQSVLEIDYDDWKTFSKESDLKIGRGLG